MELAQEVHSFCKTHRLQLNKDLGQHFLIDQAALESIVETADIRSQDCVVEIGPGIGVLTRELLKAAKHVTAIEIDTKLIPLLNAFTHAPHHLTPINGNALQVPFPTDPYKVVANIPYHITSPLLRHAFLESKQPPQSLTLLMQKEVAEKICDTEHAGLLTILVHLFGTPHMICTVPPASFLPPPQVDSAILYIECFSAPLASPEILQQIFTLAKHAFSQKRKMLRNTVGTLPHGMELLHKACIDPTRRPQTVTVQEWIELAKYTVH